MKHTASDHPSRKGWPEQDVPPTPEWAPAVHNHGLPLRLVRILVGIGAFMLLLAVGLGCLTYYVYLDHEFVLGRGQYRDAEDARMEQESIERLRQFACDLLDGLPAGPLLDPKRQEYGCGPGVPLESLPPEAQDQLHQFASGVEVSPDPSPMVKPRQAPQDEPGTPTPSPDSPDVCRVVSGARGPGCAPTGPAARHARARAQRAAAGRPRPHHRAAVQRSGHLHLGATVTEPTMTLDQEIIAASQELARARRTRPRDQARIDAAQAEYDRLIAIRDAGV